MELIPKTNTIIYLFLSKVPKFHSGTFLPNLTPGNSECWNGSNKKQTKKDWQIQEMELIQKLPIIKKNVQFNPWI